MFSQCGPEDPLRGTQSVFLGMEGGVRPQLGGGQDGGIGIKIQVWAILFCTRNISRNGFSLSSPLAYRLNCCLIHVFEARKSHLPCFCVFSDPIPCLYPYFLLWNLLESSCVLLFYFSQCLIECLVQSAKSPQVLLNTLLMAPPSRALWPSFDLCSWRRLLRMLTLFDIGTARQERGNPFREQSFLEEQEEGMQNKITQHRLWDSQMRSR